jgi:c-di-GMP-binding flagellar brake protein YcgR
MTFFNLFGRRPVDKAESSPHQEPASHLTVAAAAGLGSVEPEIYVVLKKALQYHCPLTIHLANRPEPYTSAILEISAEQRLLVIDDLTPNTAPAELALGLSLNIRAIVEGVELRFSTKVTQIGAQKGLRCYSVEFPTYVSYEQRRRQYRVAVPLTQAIEVHFVLPDDRFLTGDLKDLSVGGLCARIREGRLEPALDSHHLASCRVLLPNQQSIVTDVELLDFDAPDRPRVPRLRARFVDISPTAARRVAQLCAEIERMQRQFR